MAQFRGKRLAFTAITRSRFWPSYSRVPPIKLQARRIILEWTHRLTNNWWIRLTLDSTQLDRPLCRLLRAETLCLMLMNRLEAVGMKEGNSTRRREIAPKHFRWKRWQVLSKEEIVWTYKNFTHQPTLVWIELQTRDRSSCSCRERWRLKWEDRGRPRWPSIRGTDRTPMAETRYREALKDNTNETKPSTD